VNIVSSASGTIQPTTQPTTQSDNFTIQWLNFSIFTCAVPLTINVSLFSCVPPMYTELDYISCVQVNTTDFQETLCNNPTTTTVNIITSKKIIVFRKISFLVE